MLVISAEGTRLKYRRNIYRRSDENSGPVEQILISFVLLFYGAYNIAASDGKKGICTGKHLEACGYGPLSGICIAGLWEAMKNFGRVVIAAKILTKPFSNTAKL
jgi:hypothetical protein